MSESNEPNTNESVADVLARMQSELNFQIPEDSESAFPGAQENSVQPGAALATASPQPEPQPSASTEEPPSTEEDLDQMTEYMGTLLQRYGGASDEPAAPVEKPAEKDEDPMPIGETCEVPNLLSAGEYKPENIAPEKKDNIAVMRELAVHSARKAIQDSTKKKKQSDAALRKILAAGTGILGVGALALSGGALNLFSLLGLCSLIGSGYFFFKFKSFTSEPKTR